jgi:hypothetical protein
MTVTLALSRQVPTQRHSLRRSVSSGLNELPRGNCCAKSSRNVFSVCAAAESGAPA